MAISIPDSAWTISQSITDIDTRLRFLESVIRYRLDGEMPSEDIAPYMLFMTCKKEKNEKIRQKMLGNSNAKKVKTVKTVVNSSKQLKTVDAEEKEYGNVEINELISDLKQMSNNLNVVYDKKDERNFARHILTAKDFGDFADKIGQSRKQFAMNIMVASVKINFWKGACTGPKAIYQNYAEVYNKTLQEHNKYQKNAIQSF